MKRLLLALPHVLTDKLAISVFSEAVIISGSLAPSALHFVKDSLQLNLPSKKNVQAQLPFAFLYTDVVH